MNTQLMPVPILFEFEELPVRIINDECGEKWFCAKDICTALGYTNTSKAITDHCREAGVTIRYTSSGGQRRELAFINEGNLYRLIIKSRKEEAKRFEAWVCDEVLPSLRETGSYRMSGRSMAAAQIANHRMRLSLLKELHRTRDRALRSAIHEQLADVSRSLGLSVPELDSIGWAERAIPDVVVEFWQALEFLDSKGLAYNHSVSARLVAVNFPHLAELLIQAGLPLRVDGYLRRALWEAKKPRCLHRNHVVRSAITKETARCWVFERPELPLLH
jgi:prophage antirepressor-like protein